MNRLSTVTPSFMNAIIPKKGGLLAKLPALAATLHFELLNRLFVIVSVLSAPSSILQIMIPK